MFTPMQTWRPIPDYSRYEVSEMGDIRNKQTGRLIKPHIAKHRPNYSKLRITLVRDDGRCRNRAVARHILSAFVRLPLSGEVARHLDDDIANNHYKNLAWGTPKQNADDAKRNGGGNAPFRKITPEQVKAIRAAPRGKVAALARSLGIHKEAARKIARGQRYVEPMS
jgi:NUMOD4 motif/HNH endonuclease